MIVNFILFPFCNETMVLILDCIRVIQVFQIVEGFCLHRKSQQTVFSEKTYFTFLHAQHVLSYHLILVPWIKQSFVPLSVNLLMEVIFHYSCWLYCMSKKSCPIVYFAYMNAQGFFDILYYFEVYFYKEIFNNQRLCYGSQVW